MPSAFFAVFRDVAKLATLAADDLASQSAKLVAAADDIAALTGKAAAKTAGIAGDDLAVGAAKVSGISPARELPALWRIARASFLNKLWLTAAILAVNAWLPPAITVALVAGGLYLAFEGGRTVLDRLWPPAGPADDAPLTEDEKVRGAILTDLILSLEILVISLVVAGDVPFVQQLGVLLAMTVLSSVVIYGLIALLIRLDDLGLAMARTRTGAMRRVGERLARATPAILAVLGPLGLVAMLAVAGGIFTHLAHVSWPHAAVGLLGDIAVGGTIGLVLAAAGRLLARVARPGTTGA